MHTENMPIKIFLASRSPRRKELLKRLGLPFRVVKSSYREKIVSRNSPSQNAMRNAKGKALSAKVNKEYGFVVGADTFIYFRSQIIGKPKNFSDACRILEKLSGNVHYVYTGLAVYDLRTKRIRVSYAKSKVTFKKLSRSVIKNYVHKWRPLDKAGAYAVQEGGEKLIKKVEGSISNVIGLPIELFADELFRCAKDGV